MEDKVKTTKEKSEQKSESSSKRRILRYVILLLVLLVLTNPGTLFFLPENLRMTLTAAWSGLLGDVTQISKIVSFSWITFFQLIVMVLVVLLVSNIVKTVLEKIKPKTAHMRTLLGIASSIVSYATILIGIFWGLAIIGVNVSTLFASAGIIVLIISFGAESLIADVVTGCFMLFENQYQVGDIVEVDGFRGTVSNITIRTTCVTDAGENTKIFNNSDMRNIVNLSNKLSAAVCDISIAYEADLKKVREEMDNLLPQIQKKYPDIFREVPQYLGVQELGDSAVVLRVVAHVEENNRFKAFRLLNEELKIGLEEAGMPCPFPQLVVHQLSLIHI